MTGLGNLVTNRTCLSSAMSYWSGFGWFGDDLNCEGLVLLEPDIHADIHVRFVTDCAKSVTKRTHRIISNLVLFLRCCDTVTRKTRTPIHQATEVEHVFHIGKVYRNGSESITTSHGLHRAGFFEAEFAGGFALLWACWQGAVACE